MGGLLRSAVAVALLALPTGGPSLDPMAGSAAMHPKQRGAEMDLIAGGESPENEDRLEAWIRNIQAPRSLKQRLVEVLSVKDFGCAGDGVTDDHTCFSAALEAANRSQITLRVPKGTYLVAAGLRIHGASLEGDGPDATILDVRGPGTGLVFDGMHGQVIRGFTLKSGSPGQDGIRVTSGTGPEVSRIRLLNFEGICLRLGEAGRGGVYFADVNYIECNGGKQRGDTGLLIDGGQLPNSNANIVRNMFVKGSWRTYLDLRGNKNIIIGGDAELLSSGTGPSVVFRVAGVANQIVGTYVEGLGGAVPALWAEFTSSAHGNRISDVMVAAPVPPGGTAGRVKDAGAMNEFSVSAAGANFASGARSISPVNEIPNSGFSMPGRDGRSPAGWQVIIQGGEVAHDSEVVRGNAYSLKMKVAEGRASATAWLATDRPEARGAETAANPNRYRGQAMMASVWAKSTTPGCGAIKLYTGSNAIGPQQHSGTGAWELLTVAGRIDDDAREVGVALRTSADGAGRTCEVWFSEPMAVIGGELPQYSPKPLSDQGARMAGALALNAPVAMQPGTASPSVRDGNLFTIANPRPIQITNFTGAMPGQFVMLMPQDANTSIVPGKHIRLESDAPMLLRPGKTYLLIFDGVHWLAH